MTTCTNPELPRGWRCTREAGHPGPCAGVHTSMEPAPVVAWMADGAIGPEATTIKFVADEWVAAGRKVTPLVAQ